MATAPYPSPGAVGSCPQCGTAIEAYVQACPRCNTFLYNVPPGQPSPYPVVQARINGLAVASLVLGILWFWGVTSLVALVLGHIGKRQIDESNGREVGRGMAIAGIVLGWVGFIVLGGIILMAFMLSQELR